MTARSRIASPASGGTPPRTCSTPAWPSRSAAASSPRSVSVRAKRVARFDSAADAAAFSAAHDQFAGTGAALAALAALPMLVAIL